MWPAALVREPWRTRSPPLRSGATQAGMLPAAPGSGTAPLRSGASQPFDATHSPPSSPGTTTRRPPGTSQLLDAALDPPGGGAHLRPALGSRPPRRRRLDRAVTTPTSPSSSQDKGV